MHLMKYLVLEVSISQAVSIKTQVIVMLGKYSRRTNTVQEQQIKMDGILQENVSQYVHLKCKKVKGQTGNGNHFA